MIISSMKTRVVGVGISLAKTTCAIVDLRGNIIASTSFSTTDYPIISDYVCALSEAILTMIEANGGYETIRSVGISAPSGNFKTGSIINSPNMPWKGIVPLAAMLRDQLGIAVALANNAHVMALAEHTFGAAHGMRNFVLVTVASGVGSMLFSQGLSHLGNEGFAGEFGHACVVDGGRTCGCGNKGCLEAYCSEKGLIKTAEELIAASKEPTLLSEQQELSIKTIADCCYKGDKVAIEVFRKTGEILGLGMANYASVLNPEAIILTGDMTQAGKWLLKPMRASFEEHVFHNIKNKTRILVSILKEGERDVLGASALAWDVKEYSLFK